VTTLRVSERLRRLVPKPPSRTQAALLVTAGVGLVAFLAVHTWGGGGDATSASAPRPAAVSPAGLRALANYRGEPIYWVGPRPGVTYELTQKGTELFLRYLPKGFPVGDKRPLLTVGTYLLPNAFAATNKAASGRGAKQIPVRGGGVAFYRPARPESVYVAFPRRGYQLEVFSPSPAQARRLVAEGQLKPITSSPTAATLATGVPLAVSPAKLEALSASLGQPIYWIGPRARTTYELTRKGRELFLRYLPRGAPVGTDQLEPTVGTYHVANAFKVTLAAARKPDARRVDVGRSVIGFYRPSKPQSVYLAFRSQDFQIEVYDPSPAEARQLARTGQVRPVG
jgi:hypothetical protein